MLHTTIERYFKKNITTQSHPFPHILKPKAWQKSKLKVLIGWLVGWLVRVFDDHFDDHVMDNSK